MSPPDSSVYAEYLFNLGLVGESERDKLLKWEDNMKYHASVGQYQQAWEVIVYFFHIGPVHLVKLSRYFQDTFWILSR